MRNASSGELPQVEHAEVGVEAGRDLADAILEVERAGAAGRSGEVEGLNGIELAAGQRRHFVGLAERLQLRQAGAGADIRAEADADRAAFRSARRTA